MTNVAYNGSVYETPKTISDETKQMQDLWIINPLTLNPITVAVCTNL